MLVHTRIRNNAIDLSVRKLATLFCITTVLKVDVCNLSELYYPQHHIDIESLYLRQDWLPLDEEEDLRLNGMCDMCTSAGMIAGKLIYS